MAEATVGLLRAVLELNSAQFDSGLDKSGAKIDAFSAVGKRAANSFKQLTSLVGDFSGAKVVAESGRMAEAVERVGGASVLTQREQQRVNATVSEAIEKYRLLGQQAPASLLQLQAATAGAVEKTSLLTKGMTLLVGVFSARAILNAAGDVLEFTSKLTDLSAKTGISAEALQRLNFVTAQSGISLEEVARGAVLMGKNLAGGNDSAAKAVEALGLNVSKLIAMGPEEAFLAIGEAIAKVPNPMEKAALATAIFGRAGADYLPAFTTDMRALAEQAQTTGSILSNDMVAAGDRAGDAITRLKAAGLALMGSFLGPVLPAIEALANWAGSALPSAMKSAQAGITALLGAGLRLEVWLAETAASITATVAAVPVLGRVFGQTSTDVAYFEERARHAKDTLAAFTREGAVPAKVAMQSAIPVATNFGQSMDRVATSSRSATTATKALAEPLAANTNLVSRSLSETGALTKQLEQWARVNGAVLAPSIQQVTGALQQQAPLISTMQMQWAQFAGTVQQSTASAGSSVGGFFSKVFGGAQGTANSISGLFMQAFTGGGGMVGAVKAFATQTLSNLMGMIPGIPPWVQAFSGPIVEMLSRLAGKFKSFFSGIFGGPSAAEKAGRSAVAAFEDSLHGALTAQQELEAGGEDWKRTVIAIRDAYIANGRTAAEAEADAKRLWESSKKGAEEAARVIEEIRRKMENLPTEHDFTITTKYISEGTPYPGDSNRNWEDDIRWRKPQGEPVPMARGGVVTSPTRALIGEAGPEAVIPLTFNSMRGLIPDVPAVPAMAAAFAAPTGPAMSGDTTTNETMVFVGIPVEAAGDVYRITREVVKALPPAIKMNEGKVRDGIERVIEDYNRTYTRG